MKRTRFRVLHVFLSRRKLESAHITESFLGPVYTIPFSYEDGMEMFRLGLPYTLYRFSIRHQMKTVA